MPVPIVAQLDDDIKELLGDNPIAGEKEGPELHEEIVARWSAVLKSGMEKETRKALLEKYAIAKNCPHLKSPKLNGEIRSCLPEKALKQDNFLSKIQDQIGAGVMAIGIPMNKLVCEGDKENTALQYLIEAGKIMTDMHHAVSMHRRHLIGSNVNPNMKKLLEEAPIEEMLYGPGLLERIKEAQSMKKTGAQLIKVSSVGTKSLNFKGPANRPRIKPQGGKRKREDDRGPRGLSDRSHKHPRTRSSRRIPERARNYY